MIANRECDCGRGVVVVGGMVRHAQPECDAYTAAAKGSATLGAYVERCRPLQLTSVARAANNRLCEIAARRRAGIIGALTSCICEWPLRRAETATSHDELCPAHEIILQQRAIRGRELGGLADMLIQLEGAHCALNCACRFVDDAMNGGV